MGPTYQGSRLIGLIGALVLSVCLFSAPAESQRLPLLDFYPQEELTMQCWNQTSNAWGPGPICVEDGKPLHFNFGIDTFLHCTWEVNKDDGTYDFLANVVSGKDGYRCRMPMSRDGRFHIPFYIQLWGVVEKDHFHVNTHLNFVFHVDSNKLIAVATYPVRDHFQMVIPNSMVTMHGPVKFFHRHSYDSMSNPDPRLKIPSNWLSILYYCILTFVLWAVVFFLGYRFVLKPRLVKKMLKKD
eukprot:TRINITY_DN2756_c0_g2_i1.p1 TRINITY_DN2756_c0_g2~~TRINITY_DN2756_c0_g2_i1.p1  ORF type:complete len:241 (+),score=39.65 TRINITY_DN2756_c0_g2_i1:133-855(+)